MRIKLAIVLFLLGIGTQVSHGFDGSLPVYNIDSYFSIYVNIVNDAIHSYTLRNADRSAPASIEIMPQNFIVFRNALTKTLEWDDIAKKNKVIPFSKKLPITISMNKDNVLEFIFEYNYSGGSLKIQNGNTSKIIFSYVADKQEVVLILGNTTDQVIQNIINKERIRQETLKTQDSLFN